MREAAVEYRLGSTLFGIVVLAAVGFFLLFPQFKPDWVQIHIGSSREGARGGGFHARHAAWLSDAKSAEARFERGMAQVLNEEWDQAIATFTEVIRQEPKNAEAYYNRGLAWAGKREWDKAVSDFDAFLRLAPSDADGLLSRAGALAELGQIELALADADAAIRLVPSNADAYGVRGKFREDAGDYRLALADYEQAVRLAPDEPLVLNDLAWLLATAPDAQLRDGRRALSTALRAVEIEEAKEWDSIDTLAAAFAEAGKFSEAVKSQNEAIRLAPPDEQSTLRSRLELYQAGKPYRLPDRSR
jgi:tetratricopeptide (TPR) repeat protein